MFDAPDPDHKLWKFSEADALKYIERSLNEGQESDAGNTILFFIGTGRLSGNSINQITDLLLKPGAKFKSKIGKIMYPKVCLELWKFHIKDGNLELAQLVKDQGGFE